MEGGEEQDQTSIQIAIQGNTAFHQVLVFLCIKSVPVPHVQPEERFLVGRVGPKESRLYRCIVRYGFHDVQRDDLELERDLICSIAEFIRTERSEPRGVDGIAERSNETMMVIGTLARVDGIQLCDENSDDPPAMSSFLFFFFFRVYILLYMKNNANIQSIT